MSSRKIDADEATGGSFWSTPQREGILMSDLSVCEPRSAVLSKPKEDCWYTVPYETRDGIKGVLLGKGGTDQSTGRHSDTGRNGLACHLPRGLQGSHIDRQTLPRPLSAQGEAERRAPL